MYRKARGGAKAGLPPRHAGGTRGGVEVGRHQGWPTPWWPGFAPGRPAVVPGRFFRPLRKGESDDGGRREVASGVGTSLKGLDALLELRQLLMHGGNIGLHRRRCLRPVGLRTRKRPSGGRDVGISRWIAHGSVAPRRRLTLSRSYRHGVARVQPKRLPRTRVVCMESRKSYTDRTL